MRRRRRGLTRRVHLVDAVAAQRSIGRSCSSSTQAALEALVDAAREPVGGERAGDLRAVQLDAAEASRGAAVGAPACSASSKTLVIEWRCCWKSAPIAQLEVPADLRPGPSRAARRVHMQQRSVSACCHVAPVLGERGRRRARAAVFRRRCARALLERSVAARVAAGVVVGEAIERLSRNRRDSRAGAAMPKYRPPRRVNTSSEASRACGMDRAVPSHASRRSRC